MVDRPHALLRLLPLQAGGLLDSSGGDQTAAVPLPPTSQWTIGRKASCQLVIAEAHAYVSGEHCRVHVGDSGTEVILHDLSANGTYINGAKVGKGKSAAVPVGSEISLAKPARRGGSIKFRLENNLTATAGAVEVLASPAEFIPPAATAVRTSVPIAPSAAARTAGEQPAIVDAAAVRPTVAPPAIAPPAIAPPPLAGACGSAPAAVATPPAGPGGQPKAAASASGVTSSRAKTPPPLQPVVASSPAPGVRPSTPTATKSAPVIGLSANARAAPLPKVSLAASPKRAGTAPPLGAISIALQPQGAPPGESAFLKALAREGQASSEVEAQLQKSCKDEHGRVVALSERLRAVRLEAERGRICENEESAMAARSAAFRDDRHAEVGFGFAEANVRMARECEELRERVEALRLESRRLESECPALQEQVLAERRKCSEIHAELDDQRKCKERAQVEEAALQAEVDEASLCEQRVRDEVAAAAALNANLEEQCAEAFAETVRAKEAAETARRRLEGRGHTLTRLRGAVREHARRVGERLAQLEQALQEVPAGAGSQGAGSSGSDSGGPVGRVGEASVDCPSPRSTQSARRRPPGGESCGSFVPTAMAGGKLQHAAATIEGRGRGLPRDVCPVKIGDAAAPVEEQAAGNKGQTARASGVAHIPTAPAACWEADVDVPPGAKRRKKSNLSRTSGGLDADKADGNMAADRQPVSSPSTSTSGIVQQPCLGAAAAATSAIAGGHAADVGNACWDALSNSRDAD